MLHHLLSFVQKWYHHGCWLRSHYGVEQHLPVEKRHHLQCPRHSAPVPASHTELFCELTVMQFQRHQLSNNFTHSMNQVHQKGPFHTRNDNGKFSYILNTKWATKYKLFQSSSPCYLCDLITVQPSWSTQSSALVTLLEESVDSSLKITDHFFWYAASHLWNRLPTLRVSYQFNFSSSFINQLFSVVILRSWTTCWPFSWHFPFLSQNFPFLKVCPYVEVYPFLRLISWNYDPQSLAAV